MRRSAIIGISSRSSSRYEPCSIESTPASVATRNPGPPSAWHMTRRPSECASSTSAFISSSEYSESLGPWPARELAPPVVAHLITSAPARTMVRTVVRTASTPSATLDGKHGSLSAGARWPDGLTRSPSPPVGEMIARDSTRRGPGISPSWMATRKPRAAPAGVANRGVAHVEYLPRDGGRPEMPGRARLVEPPALRELVAVEREMVVTVDEPGQHREIRRVDHLGAGRPAGSRP